MARLKILSWNIWMMPPLIRQSPKNEARAKAIADELAKRDFDIIVFEQGIRWRGARRPARGSRPALPAPLWTTQRLGARLQINGGVWVLSTLPLTPVREIEYRDYVLRWEGFSRKGAMLLSGYADNKPLEIIGTHLQGESGSGNENQAVRNKQIAQLANELVSKADPTAPLFICGDFNTQRLDSQNAPIESPSYLRMLQLFGAANGPEHRITLDDDRSHNDLALYNEGRQAELDYVLVRPGGARLQGGWETVHITHPGWDGPDGHKKISPIATA